MLTSRWHAHHRRRGSALCVTRRSTADNEPQRAANLLQGNIAERRVKSPTGPGLLVLDRVDVRRRRDTQPRWGSRCTAFDACPGTGLPRAPAGAAADGGNASGAEIRSVRKQRAAGVARGRVHDSPIQAHRDALRLCGVLSPIIAVVGRGNGHMQWSTSIWITACCGGWSGRAREEEEPCAGF